MIPPEDAAKLKAEGVAGVYTPKDFDLNAIVGVLEERTPVGRDETEVDCDHARCAAIVAGPLPLGPVLGADRTQGATDTCQQGRAQTSRRNCLRAPSTRSARCA